MRAVFIDTAADDQARRSTSPEQAASDQRAPALPALAVLGGIALVLALVLTLGMTKRLDHDEHQFISSAVLLARDGLLPYRDYPYFHMPYLIAVYAALF